ncbi:hypothetical protein YYC_00230 [Plasmodium yoelii 17X]|uniref:Uncharacterized protein n=1 Tax=Plasmodium yoelii 17X TaxID=1323249 RepID=V7PWG5_PLAYE|nr:hypothetical protein YYC_00230 [Plasmodium yoelii 17X]
MKLIHQEIKILYHSVLKTKKIPKGVNKNKTNLSRDSSNHLLTSDTNQGGSGGSIDSECESGSEQGATYNVPGAKETQSTPETPFNIRPYIFRISLNGMNRLNNNFMFFGTYKEKIINISNVIHDIYNTTLSNIKNGFDKYINFFNDIIDNISSGFKKVETYAISGIKNMD